MKLSKSEQKSNNEKKESFSLFSSTTIKSISFKIAKQKVNSFRMIQYIFITVQCIAFFNKSKSAKVQINAHENANTFT